ncbi:MAG TPA: non-homologous end-joining DNA ligase, partial [Chthoniobacteraceae bacterium]
QWKSTTPAEKHARRPPPSHLIVTPAFIKPMQCKAVTKLPSEAGWTFEIKFDGYRCLAMKNGNEITLFSRNEKTFNDRFPDVVEALRTIKGDFVLDGEIVALDEHGKPSFQLLQNSRSRALQVYLYAFDLLNWNGEALHTQPIERRRERLNELLSSPVDPLRLSPLLQAPASQVLEAVQTLGLEGVVGKRNGSAYESGNRSGAWVKQRTNREQEFVIAGYVPGTHGFDSLLVGVYESRRLHFVAKVRNGFVAREEIFPELRKLVTPTCPFVNLPETKASRWGEALTAEKMKECLWLKPKLVCQVAFVEWTEGGKLRHCTFVAMRHDKKAATVVRET